MCHHKKAVQTTFSRSAGKYVSSALHAKGEDLQTLVEMMKTTGKEKVLDIAVGGGHVSNALAPKANEVIAMDVTREMLQSAEAFIRGNGHENVRYVEGDAENMPFEDREFEIAVCRIAAHHFTRPDVFLEEAFRVIKEGGTFYLLDNTAPEINEFDSFYNKIEKKRDPSHARAWKKSEWMAKIEAAGFTVQHLQRFPKTFHFQDWCDRLDVSNSIRKELHQQMMASSKAIQGKFKIEMSDGEVSSFSGESVLLKATK
ncbi:ubiquinone/menaquinone biosynthesis C-methylase UbiE [Geomicrobium halophilum]|uniref:Ubiquinone/menaquinone biosynthesis C-methylase UbiE n=1 Tax=Geomicrobium halophilum TaxID=549000 RepID=A0A841PZJ7_9BACL|nr:class I SAM-dependent methyltransferase [Geomicrobium halophilum]MBB6450403.1 ubiquinone/menaquinone biosynthesis C-methylase UbiE [Geomicrobium halophilum]